MAGLRPCNERSPGRGATPRPDRADGGQHVGELGTLKRVGAAQALDVCGQDGGAPGAVPAQADERSVAPLHAWPVDCLALPECHEQDPAPRRPPSSGARTGPDPVAR